MRNIIHGALNLFKGNNPKVIKLIGEAGQAESRAVVQCNSIVIGERITEQVYVLVNTETENHKCTRRNFLFTPISLPDKEGYIWYACDHPGCNKIAKFHPSKAF